MYSMLVTMTKIIVLIIVLGSCLWFYNASQTKSVVTSEGTIRKSEEKQFPEPTPLPFAELTIPYLQKYTYSSQLGNLQKISEQSTYHEYLTSYTSDDLRINALLTIPTGEVPAGGWPAIVFIHGYIPPTQYKTQEKYIEYVNFLARSGFIVFKIDLRGHGQSEGEAGGAYYSADYIIDALNAHTALQSLKDVNSRRIGLWGHSMAGNVVARTIAARPSIKAGVIWAGAVYTYQDMIDYGISDGSYRPPEIVSPRQLRRQLLYDTHGRFSATSEFWQQVVPVSYLKEYTGALQLHHAIDDGVVSINYSRNLVKNLEGGDMTLELHEYKSGGHNLSGPSFTTAMQRTVDFFNQEL
jgi:uncharacterized protein